MAQRGRGWLVRYPIGSTEAGPGPAARQRREVGHGRRSCGSAASPLSLALAVTQGTLSYPRVRRRQRRQAGLGPARLDARRPRSWPASPAPSGEFLAREVRTLLAGAARDTYRQQALGPRPAVVLRLLDRARARRLEPLARCPRSTPRASRTRSTRSASSPRAATSSGPASTSRLARRAAGDRRSIASEPRPATLGRAGDAGRGSAPAGAPRRHVLLKASWQHNWRDGGRVRENDLVAAQVLLWF